MEHGSGLAWPDDLRRLGVTRREAEVFWLVGDRLHNREISEQLVVSVRTVESHVAALLRKLGADTRAELVARAAALRSRSTARRPLPRPLDRFVGRDEELAGLQDDLDFSRLVTLTGPPGSGKTRLALEFAGRAERPPVFVDLARIPDAGAVRGGFLEALGVVDGGKDQQGVLRQAVTGEHAWLLVDNCEHVWSQVSEVLHDLLTTNETLRVLATSQRPLGVPGERIRQVGPLPLPSGDGTSADAVLAAPATRLFVERARARTPTFDGAATAESVAALCRRLDGLPLAIELAAARMQTYTPDELLRRLTTEFDVLGDPDSGGARHATVSGAVEWSYGLLGAREQRLLQILSVFPGEFDYDEVAPVAGDAFAAEDIALALPRLVDRSLLTVAHRTAQTSTYRLLDSIRRFAAARLEAAGDGDAARGRRAQHVLSMAASAGPELKGASQVGWINWFDRHWVDLAQAMTWALVHEQHDLAWSMIAGVGAGWEIVGTRHDVYVWLDALAAAGLPGDAATAVAAAQAASTLYGYTDSAAALHYAEQATVLARTLDSMTQLRARIALGWALTRSEDTSRAAAVLQAALADLPEHGDEWDRANGLQGLGRSVPGLTAALEHFDQAAELFAVAGDRVKQANVLFMMAGACLQDRQRLDDAARWLAAAQRLVTAVGNHHERLHVELHLARLQQVRGESAAAQGALRELLPGLRSLGDRRCVMRCLLWLGELALASADQDSAQQYLADALPLAVETASWRDAAEIREHLATVSRSTPTGSANPRNS